MKELRKKRVKATGPRKSRKHSDLKRAPARPVTTQSPPRLSARVKGKGRAEDNGGDDRKGEDGEDDDEGEDDDDDDDDNDGEWQYTSGPLPKGGIDAAQELGKRAKSEAEAIARKYHKRTKDVLLHAGLGLRQGRKSNPWCKYKIWHSQKFPKNGRKDDKGNEIKISKEEYQLEMKEAYAALTKGKDEDERNESLAPILEYVAEFEKGLIGKDIASKTQASMMSQAKKQFGALAEAYSTYDIAIAGAIVSVSPDPAAIALNGMFSSEDCIRDFIESNELDIRRILDVFRTCVQGKKFNLKRFFRLPGEMDVGEEGDAIKRDARRSIFTRYILSLLQAHGYTKTTVPWKSWGNVALLLRLRLINWPIGLLAGPSSTFNLKACSTGVMEALTDGIIANEREKYPKATVIEVEEWSEDDKALYEAGKADGKAGDIPLVIADNGQVLMCLRDAPDFNKQTC
ncbi:hypothetical protein PLICRDRAFT_181258 [Plicaturopsis crispa FD-325 SS-3]|uniref:Uncharacterized protein n=1 Tax=Plicaturopsis crispa FD-325 SS-3 TaxID=944288 RepID=A0A0C9SUT5_PLICR|nr:hypothetical protein PLICRDRAFT_181258 [Plicaturopsis crispa FD-325 SS-3]